MNKMCRRFAFDRQCPLTETWQIEIPDIRQIPWILDWQGFRCQESHFRKQDTTPAMPTADLPA
jgi:hypothetical protein